MQLVLMSMTLWTQRERNWVSTYEYKHGRSERRVNRALISSFTYDVTILSTNCLRWTFVGHEPFFHIPNSRFVMDEATSLKAKCDVVLGKVNKLLEAEE